MRYLALNVLVSVIALASVVILTHAKVTSRRILYVLLIMLVLTAVFDSLLVHSGIVAYNSKYILGIYIGKAPIEDFLYMVVAALAGPLLWDYYERKK